jgi:hypothetical protein
MSLVGLLIRMGIAHERDSRGQCGEMNQRYLLHLPTLSLIPYQWQSYAQERQGVK